MLQKTLMSLGKHSGLAQLQFYYIFLEFLLFFFSSMKNSKVFLNEIISSCGLKNTWSLNTWIMKRLSVLQLVIGTIWALTVSKIQKWKRFLVNEATFSLVYILTNISASQAPYGIWGWQCLHGKKNSSKTKLFMHLPLHLLKGTGKEMLLAFPPWQVFWVWLCYWQILVR